MGKIVTIDFDNFTERIDEAYQCLIDFLPCKVRISGGWNGLHFKKYCKEGDEFNRAWLLREKYDDPKRLCISILNGKVGMDTNVLLGHFCFRNKTTIAGEWIIVRNVDEANTEFKIISDKIAERMSNENNIKV